MKVETRKEVEALSLDAIVMELSSLKLAIGKHLTEVEERLPAEAVRLAALKEAAAEQEARLRELHEIEAAAGSWRRSSPPARPASRPARRPWRPKRRNSPTCASARRSSPPSSTRRSAPPPSHPPRPPRSGSSSKSSS
ncbi:MAG: hypothetical protein ACP5VF_07880 [Acidobacteriota bacterium]